MRRFFTTNFVTQRLTPNGPQVLAQNADDDGTPADASSKTPAESGHGRESDENAEDTGVYMSDNDQILTNNMTEGGDSVGDSDGERPDEGTDEPDDDNIETDSVYVPTTETLDSMHAALRDKEIEVRGSPIVDDEVWSILVEDADGDLDALDNVLRARSRMLMDLQEEEAERGDNADNEDEPEHHGGPMYSDGGEEQPRPHAKRPGDVNYAGIGSSDPTDDPGTSPMDLIPGGYVNRERDEDGDVPETPSRTLFDLIDEDDAEE